MCDVCAVRSSLLVLKLLAQHLEHMVDGLFLQIGLLHQHLAGCIEDCLGGLESYALDGVYNPLVDFVAELIEIDIVLLRILLTVR